MPNPNCIAPDCEKRSRSSTPNYCEMHYYRLRRTGSLDRERAWHRRTLCTVEGCGRPERYTSLCVMHHARMQHHGSTELLPPGSAVRSGAKNGNWRGNDIVYVSAHARLRRVRGPAKQFDCVDCGQQAKEWSYCYTDANQQESSSGPYSADPSHYEPRCSSCHKTFDNRMWLELQW